MFEKDLSLEYEQFRPIVENIKNGLNNDSFIGEGSESRVWRTSLMSGEFVVKIFHKDLLSIRGRPADKILRTKNKMLSGMKSTGIDGLEQFVTGSPEDFATIYKFVDGIRLTDIRDEYVEMITEEQKENLNITIAKATEAGLVFDGANPSGANAFYSPEKGFTLIDLSEAYRPVSYSDNWSFAIRSLGPLALKAFMG